MPVLINCMVVDDNMIDRKTALSYLKAYSFINIMGDYASPIEAVKAATATPPDALFLDIDMPELSGLQVRKQLSAIPACVFITSYPDYAVDAFDVSALDFLVKPFAEDRFAKTMQRLYDYFTLYNEAATQPPTVNDESIFIKVGHEQVKINVQDVIYLEALKDYTGIITSTQKYLVLSPLGTLISTPPFNRFIRIHRSYAIQRNYVQKIMPAEVIVNGFTLPVGRTYKESLSGITN